MTTHCLKELIGYISSDLYPSFPISNCAVDSRLVTPGGLFFALPGMRSDGHAYLGEVAQKGACAAVVHQSYNGPNYGLILVKVPDPLHSLQCITRCLLQKRKSRIVGITGSVGKTTTKEFTSQLLSQKYNVMASPGNSNSQTGLPLNILNLTQGNEDILVLEMGMTEAGNIRQLVSIAPPEVAVITTTALVHAENFSSLEAIGRAKAEIFSHPLTQWGILHRNILNFQELCDEGTCTKFSFSLQDSLADLHMLDQLNLLVFKYYEEEVSLNTLPVPGDHNLHNFLAAVAVAKYFKMSWKEINEAIPLLKLPALRFEKVVKNSVVFINDSYNASEASVKAALKTLPPPNKGSKRIAVLGSMLELGKFSENCHTEVGQFALQHVDQMICFGEECKVIYNLWKAKNRPVEYADSLDEIIKILKRSITPGDVVLLKGSRAKGLWKVLDEL